MKVSSSETNKLIHIPLIPNNLDKINNIKGSNIILLQRQKILEILGIFIA